MEVSRADRLEGFPQSFDWEMPRAFRRADHELEDRQLEAV